MATVPAQGTSLDYFTRSGQPARGPGAITTKRTARVFPGGSDWKFRICLPGPGVDRSTIVSVSAVAGAPAPAVGIRVAIAGGYTRQSDTEADEAHVSGIGIIGIPVTIAAITPSAVTANEPPAAPSAVAQAAVKSANAGKAVAADGSA